MNSKTSSDSVSASEVPETIDPRRAFLGYLFFTLGVILTLYQYYLIARGPMLSSSRQISIIFVNTLAVYIGLVLVYPWHTKSRNDYEGPRHLQRMMAVSLILCFITMVGLALALIMGPEKDAVVVRTQGSDLFNGVQTVTETSAFPWSSYLIAALYMIGYGVVGVGPWIIKWLINQVTGRSNSAGPDQPLGPQPKEPSKKKTYPIETRFVVGRVRKKRVPKRQPEDTAQD